MAIALLHLEDCPSWELADARPAVIAAERGDLTLSRQLIETPEEAEHAGSLGPPSIHVDGVDLFAQQDSQVGPSCRRNLTQGGYVGAPMLEQSRPALTYA